MKLRSTLAILAIGASDAFGPYEDGTKTYQDRGYCGVPNGPSTTETSAQACLGMCLETEDDLVAIHWWAGNQKCYCEDSCPCMADAGDQEVHLITLDSKIDKLPPACVDR